MGEGVILWSVLTPGSFPVNRYGGRHECGKHVVSRSCRKEADGCLAEFVGVFASKGWLKQSVRIKRRDRRYRIFCSERKFFSYRINDNCGISPGFPGWLVCIVTHDEISDDSKMPDFASAKPSAHHWLRCIAHGDFELI